MSDLRIISEHFQRLASYLQSPSIFAVMIHRYDSIGVIDSGRLSLVDVSYPSAEDLRREIHAFLKNIRIQVNEKAPVIEIPFSDGTYLVITDEPVTQGPTVTIEMPQKYPKVTIDHFLKWKSLSRKMGEFLKASISRGINTIVSSNDEVTRQVFLNSLTRFTTRSERIVVIDHNREIFTQNRHVAYFRSHLNFHGEGMTISSDELIDMAQRRGCDRLILDSINEKNCFAFLKALSSGTRGMSTINAESTTDALNKLLDSGLYSSKRTERELIENLISKNLHVIIQINRQADNQRRVERIDEIVGGGESELRLESIYEANVKEDGETDYLPTTYVPQFLEYLAKKGTSIEKKLFES